MFDLSAPAVVKQTLSKKSEALGGGLVLPAVETFKPGVRDVTLSKHARRFGRLHAELWIVHEAGHAWTGGSSKGSFRTNPVWTRRAKCGAFFGPEPRKAQGAKS